MSRRKDQAELSSLSVVELVAIIAQRQPEADLALEILINKYNWRVNNVFYKLYPIQYAYVHEDAAQIVWMKVYYSIKEVESAIQFFAFLVTVAKNVIISFLKAEAKHQSIQIENISEPTSNLSNVEESFFNLSERYQDLQDLRKILKPLNSTDRLIIILYDHDYSFEEIQYILGKDMASDAEIMDRAALLRYNQSKLTHEQVAEILRLSSAVITRMRFFRAKQKVERFLDNLESGEDQQRLRAVWHRFIGKK